MADDGTRKLGPGTLKIGAVGSQIDVSCLLNSGTISADKNEGDSTTKLCGTVKPGAITYAYHFDGNVDTDVALETGFFALTQSDAGKQVAFEYIPNEEFAAPATSGTKATGDLVLDPLDFGGDTMGEYMTSDFSFTVVGPPQYDYSIVGAAGTSAGAGADTADTTTAEPAA